MAAAPYHHRLLLFFLTLCSFSPFCFPLSDADALLQLKRSFANADATLSSWVPNSSPCQARWVGVVCYNTTITGLHLSDLGLSGKIDIDAMVNVPTLRTVSFMNNSFSGPIPEFNKLGALKALYISTNQFSGPIPPDFFSFLDSLKKVWLSGNKFSGNIPDSLTELDMLKELHLENNEFSGPIPAFTQDIKSLDFSNNKLQGQIPETLSRFGAEAFKGNDGLCGKPLDKPCGGAQSNSVPSDEAGQQESSSRIVLLLVCVAIAVLIMIAIKSSKQRRGGDDFSVLSRENTDEVIQVQATTGSNKSRESESTKRGGSVRRGAGKNANGDLVLVNGEKGMFGMPDLMKAAAEVLGNGALGSAYKAAMGGGLCVVVKRMREMNQAGRDCFDAEMRGFGRIRHPNILTPLAYHFRKEEKLVVSEYMPRGSLLYVLHGDRGTCHADLTWPIRLKIVKGIGNGLKFLHTEFAASNELPHGNLKSSNVLLSESYEPLLADYAFHPLLNPNAATQSLFAFKSPDYIQYQKVSHKTDVYCFGVIILEIMTGKFPSQYHSNGKGGTDVVQWVQVAISENRESQLIDPQIASDSASLDQMVKLLKIGAVCTESNPDQRPSLSEAISRIGEVRA